MATYTTNINLKKPAQSDKIRIADFNTNADNIDAALGAGFGQSSKPSVNAEINSLADGIAIVSQGDVHGAITSGQFVYVRNHSTLSNGLYVANQNISANATLTSSNLDADSSGGLNALSAKIAPLTEGEKWADFVSVETLTNGENYGSGCKYRRIGCFVHILIGVQFSSAPTNTEIFTLPVGYRPVTTTTILIDGGATYNAKAQCVISDAGVVRVTSVDKWATGGGLFVAVGNL